MLAQEGRTVVAARRTHPVRGNGITEITVDLRRDSHIHGLVERWDATHVVHAAALTDVDRCERDQAEARRLHIEVPRMLAEQAARHGSRFVFVSTDQLWRGDRSYVSEVAPPEPVNVYARTKAAGESAVLGIDDSNLVIRTNFFGGSRPWRRSSSDSVIEALRGGRPYRGFHDVWFTPLALPLLCEYLVEVTERGVDGILHLGGADRISKLDFARLVATHNGFGAEDVVSCSVNDSDLIAARPRDMSLDCSRASGILGRPMPSIWQSIERVYGN